MMEKEVKYEVCRLHSDDDGNCVPDIHLGFHTPNNRRTHCPYPCSYRRLLHYLEVSAGEGQRGQSNDGISLQENWITVIFLHIGRIMGTHHHIPILASCRGCSNRNSSRILGSAIEQSSCLEKTETSLRR